MKTTTIRDFSGKILGYVEEDSSGRKTVRTFFYKIVATYDPFDNTTRTFHGRIIAYGDVAVSQLYNEENL